jgi:DNA (cytosine-5)-methyltransferase 1
LKIRSGCAGGGKGALVQTEKTGTLSTLQDQTLFQPVPILNDQGGGVMGVSYNVTGTLRAAEHGHQPIVFESNAQPVVLESNQIHATVTQTGICPTLSASMGMGGGYIPMVTNKAEKAIHWIVRRLTPTECERLQGYPDGWTDIGEWTDTKGKKHKPADSPRYKALGNSIALPQWFWIAQKMKPYLPADATLGSLFDGIGGFPLIWETTYGTGTAAWASEIEEFPIAVTKRRLGEE